MSTITIRPATEEDAELIADLSQSTFYDSFAPYNTKEDMDKFLGEQFTRPRLIEEVGQPWHIFFLAFLDGEAAGYVKMREGKIPEPLLGRACIEIARIYAVQRTIGKGIGSALMQACVDTAVQKKKKVLWLGVWEHNLHAIDFYVRWGFEKFGDQEFLLGNDLQTDWLMKKEL